MSGFLHAGKRGIEEFVETVFATPIALGSVSNLEQEMSAALAPAHAAAVVATVAAVPDAAAAVVAIVATKQPRY